MSIPIALIPGVVDENDYGNKFNGVSNEDGEVCFTFDATEGDLNLSLFGYDVDWDDEIEVLLNGVSIGFLSAGPNNSLEAQNFLITAAEMVEGENTISFVQTYDAGFAWGVTNVMLDTPDDEEEVIDTPVANLTQGVANTGSYGNRFDGERDFDGLVSYTFDDIGEDIVLSFDGYDLDRNGEVELYLNGTLVGPVDAGANNRLNGYSYEFAAEDLLDGQNTITFKQTINVNQVWGVTNVMFDIPEPEEIIVDTPVANLEQGVADAGEYGNRFNGMEDEDGMVTFSFDGIGEDIALSFDGYDFDNDGEIELYLNGLLVGPVDAGANNRLSSYTVEFAAADLLDGQNTVTFKQAENVNFGWGVTNVKIDTPVEDEEEVVEDTPVADLTFGETDTSVHGNRFDGLTDDDGLISYTFDGTGEDIALSFDGYDFDSDGEVELYLNGTLVGPVDAGTNNGLSSYTFDFAAADVLDGENTITFKQTVNNAFIWGVTNVKIDTPVEDEEEVVEDTPVADLTFGETDTSVHGNRFDGLTDDDGLISYTFDGTGEDIALSFDGYDFDSDGEVELYLNGTLVGPVDAGTNNGLSSYTFDFAAADVLDGENTITFKQTVNNAFIWGVTNVKIDTPVEDEEEVVEDTPVANLTLGVTETGVYGNKFEGMTDDDGLISYTFDGTGEDIVLDFDGYDFDTDGEVEVYLNGLLVAPVEAGTNNGLTSYRHEFAAEDLLDGQNTITFVQAAKVSFVWGVTNVNFHTSGDDQIAGGDGDDVLFGGEGNDTFLFGLGDDRDVISDFELDGDVIELLNLGITEFSDISISNNADFDAVISFNATDVLTLTGVQADQLTAEHFDFA